MGSLVQLNPKNSWPEITPTLLVKDLETGRRICKERKKIGRLLKAKMYPPIILFLVIVMLEKQPLLVLTLRKPFENSCRFLRDLNQNKFPCIIVSQVKMRSAYSVLPTNCICLL